MNDKTIVFSTKSRLRKKKKKKKIHLETGFFSASKKLKEGLQGMQETLLAKYKICL